MQKSTVPVNCGDYVFCKNSVAGAKYRALPADENLTWLFNLCGLDVWSTLVDNAVGEIVSAKRPIPEAGKQACPAQRASVTAYACYSTAIFKTAL